MKLFTPNYYFKDVYSIDQSIFNKHKPKLVVFDLDNTLAPNNIFKPKANVKKLIKSLQEQGLKVAIVSNNSKGRVEKYCKELNIFNIPFAIKPLKRAFRKLTKEFKLDSTDVVFMIGDQLITDIAFANRSEILSILVDPIQKKVDANITKGTRKLENRIYKKLESKNILTKGKYGKIK